MTVLDYISAAMRKIGAIGQGETPTAEEGVNGMQALNAMIDSWSAQRLMIPHVARRVFSLTNASSYTIGPIGADFAAPRPVAIERAGILTTNNGALPIEYPIDVLDFRQWADVDLKTLRTGAGADAIEAIYYDNTYPKGTIYPWPINTVAAGAQIVLYSWEPILTAFTAIATAIDMPPGYQEAIIYNLAARIADEYGQPVSQAVATLAQVSFDKLRMSNVPRIRLNYGGKTPPMYNIYSDSIR